MKARVKCNAAEMFKRLRDVVRSDCEEARGSCEAVPALKGIEFRNDADNCFKVIRQPPSSVNDVRAFSLQSESVVVCDDDDRVLFRVNPRLNSDDECVFESEDWSRTYRAWEVSRKALEGLFFKD